MSVAAGDAHKISTDIRPMVPPFLHGGKMPKNFGQNVDHNRLQIAVFLNGGALSENKNKLVKDRRQIYHHTKLGVVESSQLWELLAHWVPKRVKVENFVYILRSSGPRPAAARQYYTNSGHPGCAHKISTDPCCPPFLQEAKTSQILAKITTKSYSDRRIFELRHFIGNQKQIGQGSIICLPPYQTWYRWVPQLPEQLAQWVPERVRVKNFLLYPPLQRPTSSTAPPMLYHLLRP